MSSWVTDVSSVAGVAEQSAIPAEARGVAADQHDTARSGTARLARRSSPTRGDSDRPPRSRPPSATTSSRRRQRRLRRAGAGSRLRPRPRRSSRTRPRSSTIPVPRELRRRRRRRCRGRPPWSTAERVRGLADDGGDRVDAVGAAPGRTSRPRSATAARPRPRARSRLAHRRGRPSGCGPARAPRAARPFGSRSAGALHSRPDSERRSPAVRAVDASPCSRRPRPSRANALRNPARPPVTSARTVVRYDHTGNSIVGSGRAKSTRPMRLSVSSTTPCFNTRCAPASMCCHWHAPHPRASSGHGGVTRSADGSMTSTRRAVR